MASIFDNFISRIRSVFDEEESREDKLKKKFERQQRIARAERVPFGQQSTLGQFPQALGEEVISLAQETTRNIASAGLTVWGALGGSREEDISKSTVGKAVFGRPTEPLKSIETRLAESEIKARDIADAIRNGDILTFLKDDQARDLAIKIDEAATPGFLGLSPVSLLVAGSIFADFTPIGGSTKALKLLAKTDDVAEVFSLLKKTGIADDVIEKIAPRIATEKSEDAISLILKEAKERLAKTTTNADGSVVTQTTPKIMKSPKQVQDEIKADSIKILGDEVKQGLKSLDPEDLRHGDEILAKIESGEASLLDLKEGSQIVDQADNKIDSARLFARTDEGLLDRNQVGKNLGEQEPLQLDSRKPLVVKDETLRLLKQKQSIETTRVIAKQTGEQGKDVTRVGNSLRKIKTRLLELVQNDAERVRQLVSRDDIKIDDASDPYLKMTLYPGRIGNKVEVANKQARNIMSNIKEAGLSRQQISDYLVARHAPERNAVLGEGAAGLTTQEANDVLKLIDDLPEGQIIKEISDQVQVLNKQTLDILNESGVISDELHKTLRNTYKNHVPLNRIMDDADDVGQILSGKGFNVKSTGLRRAVGSDREVADILGNVVTNYEQAVLRSEKNIVDQATLAMVRNNKDELSGLIKEVSPKPIGKTFDGKILLETTNDPSIIQLFENGKRVWLKIEDPSLAVALAGVGREKLGPLLNAVGSFTRLYSGLATRFNPEFFLSNKIRDLQETAVYLSSQKGVGVKGALGAMGKDPGSIKDVVDSLRGLDTEGTQLYKELKELGGTTGGFGLSTRKNVELNLDKIEKLSNSKTQGIANRLVEYVDNWNEIFEDSTRLSVYKQARQQGLSKDRAAEMAKEASINFNRMGQGGPLINALWMFSNASIQGSTKMIRALKNPKVLGTVTATVGGAVATANQWNDQLDPEWRNKVSRWDRLNGLPVVLPSTDEKFRYFTIPVSWGLKPIKVMSDYAYDAIAGEEFDMKRMVEDVVTAMAEAYNPAGGSDLVSAMVPTILDVPVELARNTTWYGGKIKPDYDPNAPEDIKYYSSLSDTASGRGSIKISELLQENLGASISPADMNYAFEQYVGGTGRALGKIGNVLGQVSQEDKLPLDEYPLISRFYRERPEEELGAGTGGDTQEIKDLLENQSRERDKIKKEAQTLHNELKGLPTKQSNKRARELKKENPAVHKALLRIVEDEKLGLTFQEKLIKNLGVENGERAAFIHKQANKLKTREEKNAYIRDLREKKIVSDRVLDQLKKLAK